MFFSSNKKLGILGGGQLGKMLLYETQKWDICTHILDPSEHAPSKYLCHNFQKGNLMDYQTVYEFGKQVDTLTIEIEHVNIEALLQLEKEGIEVYPQPSVLSIIQNKIDQKTFYKTHSIPTAPFYTFNSKKDLLSCSLSFPYIWKSAKFGYDGKGVMLVKNAEQQSKLPNGACIVEEPISIEKELSVIVAKNPNGQTKSYPTVEMDFHPTANLVEYVISPARISNEVTKRASEIALQISDKMKHVGLLAVEMFLTTQGDILVNEVAPRPHNSGHFSIEGSITNQFEQHIRAILNLPLGSTAIKIPAVMINLVGAEGFSGDVYYENIAHILSLDGVTPHIYGKKTTSPFRKMGHITVVNSQIEKAVKKAKEVKETIRVITKQNL